MVINSIQDFAEYLGVGKNEIEKAIYKATACGAWIDWNTSGIRIGSIVEGSDAEFSQEFTFPVSSETIEAWLEELEELTDEAWKEANGPDVHGIVEKFEKKGYSFDWIESYEAGEAPECTETYLRFFGDGHTLTFPSWDDAEQWIENVIDE